MSDTHRQRGRHHTRPDERAQRPYSTRNPSPQREARLKRAAANAFTNHTQLDPDRWWVAVDAVAPIGRPLQTLRVWITLHPVGFSLPSAVPDALLEHDPALLPLNPLTDDDHHALAAHLQDELGTDQPVTLQIEALKIQRD
ncbi:MAG: hypothetical protein AAGI68_06395 [Planctomycetota bacterium]